METHQRKNFYMVVSENGKSTKNRASNIEKWRQGLCNNPAINASVTFLTTFLEYVKQQH